MNTGQINSVVRTVLKIAGAILLQHGLTNQAALVNSPDVCGLVVLLVGLGLSHRQHADPVPAAPWIDGSMDGGLMGAKGGINGSVDEGSMGKDKTPPPGAKPGEDSPQQCNNPKIQQSAPAAHSAIQPSTASPQSTIQPSINPQTPGGTGVSPVDAGVPPASALHERALDQLNTPLTAPAPAPWSEDGGLTGRRFALTRQGIEDGTRAPTLVGTPRCGVPETQRPVQRSLGEVGSAGVSESPALHEDVLDQLNTDIAVPAPGSRPDAAPFTFDAPLAATPHPAPGGTPEPRPGTNATDPDKIGIPTLRA